MIHISRFNAAMCLAIGSMVLAGCLTTVLLRVRWNRTASVPIGFYWESATGEYVEFCPSGPWAKMSADRGYRAPGSCFDRHEPLLKRMIGFPGDVVNYDANGVRINGFTLPASAPYQLDTEGRPIQHFPWGEYVLGATQYWVMGSNPRSFDSRYYGPIDGSQIRSRLRPPPLL
jgi:conjugative transfer signal peptidase TraF